LLASLKDKAVYWKISCGFISCPTDAHWYLINDTSSKVSGLFRYKVYIFACCFMYKWMYGQSLIMLPCIRT